METLIKQFKILFVLLFVTGYHLLFAQNVEFKFGNTLTPKGTIKVLVIFAEVDCGPCPGSNKCGPGGWTEGQLSPDPDSLLDHELPAGQQPTAFITDYYFQMSLGQYKVLGDYYPQIVTVPCDQISGALNATSKVIEILDNTAGIFTTANGLTLTDFDNWGNEGSGIQKSNSPNGTIDVVAVVWRNLGFFGDCSGFGVQDLSIFVTFPTLKGFNVKIAGSFNSCRGAAQSIFIGEYFHALFGDCNWHSAGGAGKYTFLEAPASYGLTNQSGGTFGGVNGWDRWILEYEHPDKDNTDTIFISVGDQIIGESSADISIQTHPNGATFTLRDHYTSGDAIRIKLPHIDYQNTGDIKNQYLWLENRRMNTRFDKYLNVDMGCADDNGGLFPRGTPGIYTYIQVGKDLKSGTVNDVYSGFPEGRNALGSWIMPVTGEGNFDFKFRFDLQQPGIPGLSCNWNNPNIPIEKARSLPNPLTGFSDLFKIIDSNMDGELYTDPVQSFLSEVEGLQIINNWNGTGDWEDPFSGASGKTKLSISTNPTPFPVYTYTSNEPNLTANDNPQSYENRTIYLSGLSIEITNENAITGEITVQIRWDDHSINNDVRWCGNIVLQNDTLDPLARPAQINIESGNTLLLDQGLSPTRHFVIGELDGTPLFTEPSLLTLKSGTKTTIKTGATLRVINGSTLRILAGAEITVQGDGRIIVENGGFLCVEPGAIINLVNPLSELFIDQFAVESVNSRLGPLEVIIGVVKNCQSLCEIRANIIVGNGFLNRTWIADAGNDVISCSSVSSRIIGGSPTADPNRGTDPFTYSWTPTTNINDPTIANPTTTGSISTTTDYIVTVTDANGCSDSDTMTVIINSTAPLHVEPGKNEPLNGHLEIVVGDDPAFWQSIHVTNEPTDLGNLVGGTFFNVSVSDPAPESGCRSAELPLNNSSPTYFVSNTATPMLSNTIYLLEAKVKIDNNTAATNERLDISLINQYRAKRTIKGFFNQPSVVFDEIRELSIKKSFSLRTGVSPNPLLPDWQTFRQCIPGENFFDEITSLRRAIRIGTNYNPVSDLDVRIDGIQWAPITKFTDPISGNKYQVQNFSAPSSITVTEEFNGVFLHFYRRSLTSASTNFPNASLTEQVYNFEHIPSSAFLNTGLRPNWNALADYVWSASTPIEINGIMVLQPFTHFTLKQGSGKFTLGTNGKLCMGEGAEFILNKGTTFEFAGGELDLMFGNACLGVFGGQLNIAAKQNLVIDRGFLFLFQNGSINMAPNSQLIINTQLSYQSGAKIRLDQDNTLTFEPKSRLNLADGGNGNSLPDKRLNILLNCGQLNALWEGQEATDNLPTDNLPRLNVFNSWRQLKSCPDNVFSRDTLKIITLSDDTTIFNTDLDFSNNAHVLVTGAGKVQFITVPGIPDSISGIPNTDPERPVSIIVGSNTNLTITPSEQPGSNDEILTIEGYQ